MPSYQIFSPFIRSIAELYVPRIALNMCRVLKISWKYFSIEFIRMYIRVNHGQEKNLKRHRNWCSHLFPMHCSHRPNVSVSFFFSFFPVRIGSFSTFHSAIPPHWKKFQWRPNVSDSQHTFDTAGYITIFFFLPSFFLLNFHFKRYRLSIFACTHLPGDEWE